MKKFIFCLFGIFIAISCDKDANPLCGCSPVEPSFLLIVNNAQNKDLLDSTVAGSYNKASIKISYKKDGTLKQAYSKIYSAIYGTNSQAHHVIYSEMLKLGVSSNIKEFYLDFGNGDQDTITFDVNRQIMEPVDFKVNNNPVAKEPLGVSGQTTFAIVK